MSFEMFGWISGLLFFLCAIPQAIKSYRDGHSEGVSSGLLWLWLGGEIAGIIYALSPLQPPLILNYLSNVIFVSVVAWYKAFPRRVK